MEFQHVKPGKGAAFVRTKLRDIINGGVIEKTFRPTEKFNQAVIDRVDMQFLYNDGMYNFMNNSNYYDYFYLEKGENLSLLKKMRLVKLCFITARYLALSHHLK